MIGVDDSPQNLGILPCSIAWLFKLINDQKDQTGARFSVRVSAVEVTGKQEQLKDLLADVASGKFPEQLRMRKQSALCKKLFNIPVERVLEFYASFLCTF